MSKISVITSDNICDVNERILRAAANFAFTNQKKDLRPIFIIVPDRFTLQAEKILCSVAPCILGVRVVTFSMLFKILSSGEEPIIDKTTAVLFMWRAIQDVRGVLQHFANSVNQYAFAEKMFNTINQLTSCTADFDTLERNAKTEITRRKMHDISIIQKRYKELIGGGIDGSGVLGWLISNVSLNPTVKDAHFYMTGFEYISKQREEVFKRIAGAARSVTVGYRTGSEQQRRLDEIRFSV